MFQAREVMEEREAKAAIHRAAAKRNWKITGRVLAVLLLGLALSLAYFSGEHDGLTLGRNECECAATP